MNFARPVRSAAILVQDTEGILTQSAAIAQAVMQNGELNHASSGTKREEESTIAHPLIKSATWKKNKECIFSKHLKCVILQ